MAKVRFVGSGVNQQVEIKVGELILKGAEREGIDIPSGCRYGSCYACAVEVIKGLENIDSPNPVNPKAKNPVILTCIS
ncbi:(2Fe-2S)-binding protein, partial [bacterium]